MATAIQFWRSFEMIGNYLLKSFFTSEFALDSYFYRLRRLRGSDPRCLMLVAMPKTASTFLSYNLAALLGYEHSYFAAEYYNIEPELYKPRIIDNFGKGTVVQQHFRANTPNLNLLNEYRIKPVILIRDIFDIVASIKDHLNEERIDNLPSMYIYDEFREFDSKEQFDFIVKYFAPWLISFYASWVRAEIDGKITLQWLSYNECRLDWEKAFKQILDYYSISVTASAITSVLAMPNELADRRFNKGIPGRGMELLNAEQISEIKALTRFYPTVDFSPVGIAG